MIIKEYDEYRLYCDSCGEYESFDCFEEAVFQKKSGGWSSLKIGDDWEEYCPECQELVGGID